jgi:hypothetical protein
MAACTTRWSPLCLSLLTGVACLASLRQAYADTKLYLKDGSYQLVKSYQVTGDRVRYYSVERSEWEEVPTSLVDFEATQRAQQEEKIVEQKEIQEAKELEKERFERPVQTGYEVAPGVHLPNEEGVFAFDGTRVIRMVQSEAQVVTDKKRAALGLALPAPLLKNRSLVVLPGPQAAVRIQATRPAFFINAADGWGARAQLIPVRTARGSRVIEKLQSGIGVGKSGEIRDTIPVERTQVAPGLYKLHPLQALVPGEYAVAELISDKLNLDVWDFGIGGFEKPSRAEEQGREPMTERSPQSPQSPPPTRTKLPLPLPGSTPPDTPH